MNRDKFQISNYEFPIAFALMKILFVCLGNICRSPLAEGILRDKIKTRNLPFTVDSCGTSSWHSGEAPDPRTIAVAKKYGIDVSKLRARQFVDDDFRSFDMILVMDEDNYSDVISKSDDKLLSGKVSLFLEQSGHKKIRNVPDPYYGGQEGFEELYHLLNEACDSLLDKIEQYKT